MINKELSSTTNNLIKFRCTISIFENYRHLCTQK